MEAHTRGGLILAAGIYAAAMFATLHPDTQSFFRGAFPDGVLSVSAPLFFGALMAILALPLFVLGPHLMKLMLKSDTRISGIASLVVALMRRQTDPELRRSKVIVGLLVAYFIGLMAAWIVYAEIRGI